MSEKTQTINPNHQMGGKINTNNLQSPSKNLFANTIGLNNECQINTNSGSFISPL